MKHHDARCPKCGEDVLLEATSNKAATFYFCCVCAHSWTEPREVKEVR